MKAQRPRSTQRKRRGISNTSNVRTKSIYSQMVERFESNHLIIQNTIEATKEELFEVKVDFGCSAIELYIKDEELKTVLKTDKSFGFWDWFNAEWMIRDDRLVRTGKINIMTKKRYYDFHLDEIADPSFQDRLCQFASKRKYGQSC